MQNIFNELNVNETGWAQVLAKALELQVEGESDAALDTIEDAPIHEAEINFCLNQLALREARL